MVVESEDLLLNGIIWCRVWRGPWAGALNVANGRGVEKGGSMNESPFDTDSKVHGINLVVGINNSVLTSGTVWGSI